jgi:chromosome segregation ATPase
MAAESLESPEERAAARSAVAKQMHTLTDVIRDLEDQLDRMMATNDALKQDLEQERKRRNELETKLESLKENLRRSEQEAIGKEGLSAEVSHLKQERARLSAAVRELTLEVEQREEELKRHSTLVNQLRTARGDTIEELGSVESQFERAMQMVAEAKAQILILNEERDALKGRVALTEDKYRQVLRERDALVDEVHESRAALDDISRSLSMADASGLRLGGESGQTQRSAKGK